MELAVQASSCNLWVPFIGFCRVHAGSACQLVAFAGSSMGQLGHGYVQGCEQQQMWHSLRCGSCGVWL